MIYVKKVTTNVKKAHSVSLTRKTLIVGKNGSGKSSILNSLELCFGGYASDFRGKIVRSQNDLIRLSTGSEVKVQCEMSDDSRKSVVIERTSTGTVSKPKIYGTAELELPVQEITMILESSSKVFKSWLLGHIEIDMKEDGLAEICSNYGVDISMIDTKNIIETVSIQLQSAKDNSKRLYGNISSRKKTIDGFSEAINPDVDLGSDKKFSELASLIFEYEKEESRLSNLLIDTSNVDALIALERQTLSMANEKLDAIKMNPQLLPTKVELVSSRVRKNVLGILTLQEDLCEVANCLVCDGKIDRFYERKRKLSCDFKDVDNKVELLDLKLKLEDSLILIADKVSELRKKKKALELETSSILLGFTRKTKDELTEMKNNLRILEKKMESVLFYKIRLKEIERVKRELEQMKIEHAESKRLVNALFAIQSEFVTSAKERFADKLNKVMSFRVSIDIDEKNISIGKTDGENVHYGLSGSEYLELKFAFAQVLHPTGSLILSEDKAIDEDKLIAMMKNLSTFSGQAILTSVIKPCTIPCDWTVVEL